MAKSRNRAINTFMASPDSKKSISPVPIWKPVNKDPKKKGKARAKLLTIVGTVGGGVLPEKRKKKRKRSKDAGAAADEHTGQVFRQVVNRNSLQAATEMVSHPRLSDPIRTTEVSRTRWTLFYLKLARRQIRRFHGRFSFRQMLGFYIGVPLGIALILCAAFFLAKPPKGVTPHKVTERIPSAIELVRQIQTALEAHDFPAAQAPLSDLEKYYPQDPRTFVAGGTIFAHEKNYDAARKYYVQALELSPGLPASLINLGEIEFATGNYSKAAEYYQKARRSVPHNALITFRLYLCYSLLNDPANAGGARSELATRPDSPEWYFVLASEDLRAGKKSEALQLISTAKAMYGTQAEAYFSSLKNIGWLK